jgi:2-dehydropantoate 2-reductase
MTEWPGRLPARPRHTQPNLEGQKAMRVLVMGTGGVGGYYGGMLAQQGHEVVFVARGPHLEALQSRGLELRTAEGTVTLHPISAVAKPADAGGTFDLVRFRTVSTRSTSSAPCSATDPSLVG